MKFWLSEKWKGFTGSLVELAKMLTEKQSPEEVEEMVKESQLIRKVILGDEFLETGKRTGELRHARAQAEYQEIRKEYARVSLTMPKATKKTRMSFTAKH